MSDNANNPLAGRDYAIAIDKSGSMGTILRGTKTRFQYAQEMTETMARACQALDPDGIDVYMFNNKVVTNKNVTPEKVTQVFKENTPNLGTATDELLNVVFNDYFERKKSGNARPLTLLVITDGEPNDQKLVDNAIVEATKKMERDEELAVQFIQVGDDQGARNFLKHLDDDLMTKAGAKFDIVDTKNEEELSNMSIEDVLLAAVSD